METTGARVKVLVHYIFVLYRDVCPINSVIIRATKTMFWHIFYMRAIKKNPRYKSVSRRASPICWGLFLHFDCKLTKKLCEFLIDQTLDDEKTVSNVSKDLYNRVMKSDLKCHSIKWVGCAETKFEQVSPSGSVTIRICRCTFRTKPRI